MTKVNFLKLIGTFAFLVVLASSSLLTSCATLNASKSSNAKNELGSGDAEPSERVASTPKDKDAVKQPEDIENATIEEVIRIEEPNTQNLYDNSRYDFPITVNAKVEGWIDYFTGRGRPHMERYLSRSSKYIPLMKQILKRNGLPEDLVYLALIESGFNMRAKSRARAVGPWQFMKATGKRYGLRVDAWIDERRDPLRSTEAAAKYLKDLYLMFESWYLAASAYNAGEYKILRAIESLKTNNYWRICTTKTIRRETKDYVPKLIAAAIIAKNPKKYGFDITFEEALSFEVVRVDFPIQLKDIANFVDVSEDDILDLNPELARGMVPPLAGLYEVRVPVGSRVVVERAIASMRSKGSKGLKGVDLPTEYLVKNGDTLARISKKYKIRVGELANVNNLSPREKLSPGSTILIPRKGITTAAASKQQATPRLKRAVGSGKDDDSYFIHVVRRGESLWTISEKYNVTIQEIFRWNKLQKSRIFPGKKLRIRAGDETSAAAALAGKKTKRNS